MSPSPRISGAHWTSEANEDALPRAREEQLRLAPFASDIKRRGGAAHATGTACMRRVACCTGAEGAKQRNSLKVTNADPEVLVFFARFLREHFVVRNEAMRVYCNLFADHLDRQCQIEDFWLMRLGLDRSSLRKSVVNVYSKHSQKKRTNRLPFGTTALVVHSTRIVQTIFGSIQEYGGFDRPEWLD
jgi:hypothetical protein